MFILNSFQNLLNFKNNIVTETSHAQTKYVMKLLRVNKKRNKQTKIYKIHEKQPESRLVWI